MVFYPRELCPHCLSSELEWVPVSGKGRLHSYTVIYQAGNPTFQEDTPYVYALIQLDEGPQMVSNLIDCPIDKAETEMPVVAVYDGVTPEFTLVKFRPA